MPRDAPDRGLRLVEHADLLLHRFNDPSKALHKYRAALAIENLDLETQRVAILGAARCAERGSRAAAGTAGGGRTRR